MIAKSTLSDDSFMCSLVQEQAQHSQQVYKDALKFAAVGATIGGGMGFLAAKGGIYALIAEGGGAALAAAGSVTSAWGATKEGLESKALFEKAAQASAQGDEATARSLVKQAREKAVEAGLSGVDSVLAGVAAAKTTQSFKKSLKEAPQSIAQIAENQISNKVATELTNKGHEEWRKNYQDQMKAQGKALTEPREKPVPLQESETAEAALSRLTSEGYKGLAVKDGKLVQDINRPANEIVPALNQKLNGGPAQDYAKRLVGKKVESEEDIAKMAADVHEVWMKHNSWEEAQKPHLFKKYNQLSADEQIKDLNVVEAVLRAQNDGKIPQGAEKILSNYRTKIEKQIAKDNQQLASAISLLEELNKGGSISAEDFAIIKQSKSKREYDETLKKIFEKKDAEHKAELKLIKERREPIYDSGMRHYLDEASRNGKLREGLAGKSYSEIRESPEFLKDYDSYALKVQSLPLEEKERALSKFAAEWLYPPKSP
jgi:hypothetical protein